MCVLTPGGDYTDVNTGTTAIVAGSSIGSPITEMKLRDRTGEESLKEIASS